MDLEESLRKRRETLDNDKRALMSMMKDFFTKVDKKASDSVKKKESQVKLTPREEEEVEEIDEEALRQEEERLRKELL